MSITINYYPTQADALATTNPIATGTTNPVATYGVFANWRIASNSTGPSSQANLYKTGDSLTGGKNPVTYYLYPAVITYYLTQANALANTQPPLNSSEDNIVQPFGPTTVWLIASNSTGTSSQATTYTTGNALNFDGVYYLYPNPVPITYYPTELDSTNKTNALGTSPTYSVGDGGPFGTFVNWRINKITSTGSSSATYLYVSGDLLSSPGEYFLYPAVITYYSTQADALANTQPPLGSSETVTIGTFGGFTSWKIASNSTGSSSQLLVYATGDALSPSPSNGVYYLYPSIPCFLEGTKILTVIEGKETYVPIETLNRGDLVKTSRDGYKRIEIISKGVIENPGGTERSLNRLYKCSPEKYPELTEDLVLTGAHSILVDHLSDAERAETTERLGKIFVTDKKYRLIAQIDKRSEPWGDTAAYPIWHFALEHPDDGMNYGVYANGGLLVETCSIRFLKNKSNLATL